MTEKIPSSEIRYYTLREFFNIGQFESGTNSFDEYLKNDAREDQLKSYAQTWIFVHDGKIVGYITISSGSLTPDNEKQFTIPGVVIHKLAVQSDYQCKGIASHMINFAISVGMSLRRQMGCQAILTTAESDTAIKLYLDRGFIQGRVNKTLFIYFLTDLLFDKYDNDKLQKEDKLKN